MSDEHFLLFDEHKLRKFDSFRVSVFLFFNEIIYNLINEIYNLMKEFYADEFCYQKPTILFHLIIEYFIRERIEISIGIYISMKSTFLFKLESSGKMFY